MLTCIAPRVAKPLAWGVLRWTSKFVYVTVIAAALCGCEPRTKKHTPPPKPAMVHVGPGPLAAQIKAKSARAASDRLEDCLTDHLKYSGYKADTVIPQFIAGLVSPGMPIDFAVAHLGPEDKRSMNGDGSSREYLWKKFS